MFYLGGAKPVLELLVADLELPVLPVSEIAEDHVELFLPVAVVLEPFGDVSDLLALRNVPVAGVH